MACWAFLAPYNLRYFLKPCPNKMFVESKSCLYSEVLHHKKRDTICERVCFVFVLLKILPTFHEQIFVHMNKLNGRTIQQFAPDFDSFRVIAATVEICDDFIENIRGGD